VLDLLTNFWFLVFAPATVVPVTAIVASFLYKSHRDSVEASLKHEMIARGMSADDIVKVLQATRGKGHDRRRCDRAEDKSVARRGETARDAYMAADVSKARR
jgi:hypothetical protein